ncbi:MAG TPA: allantoate amidohydrolase [Acidobacteriota bacterium]|jgi:allantoate deiminase
MPPSNTLALAQKVMQRIEQLGRITEQTGCLTRTFLSSAMRKANNQVAEWMRGLNMTVREDNMGNIIGRHASDNPNARVLLLGSHLDTVRNAGKFDGALGVIIALACLERLAQSAKCLPFHVDVAGFSDEEGVRYGVPYLGSRVLAGIFRKDQLSLLDANSVSLADAIRSFGGDPDALNADRYPGDSLVAYCEIHIEQGPVLEAHNLAVGVVNAIAGQSRIMVDFIGRAGHAGTSPMDLRQDALCGAAEFILQAESYARQQQGLVATVGTANVLPGTSNVIPGQASLTLDVRHADDGARQKACRYLQEKATAISRQRSLQVVWRTVDESCSVRCSESLIPLLSRACENNSIPYLLLPSGAGHDAVVMSAIADIAMLFIRNRDGISHHPDESVAVEDIAVAISVINEFIGLLAQKEAANRRE